MSPSPSPSVKDCWLLLVLVTIILYEETPLDYTLKAIKTGEMVYADGNEVPYRCLRHSQCKLCSILVIPLHGENHASDGQY